MKKHSALSALGQRTEAPSISWLMQAALSRPKLISLAAGFTDNESLPVADAREILENILSSTKTGQPALQYGMTAGDADLRALTAADVQQTETAALAAAKLPGKLPKLSADSVVITHGSQQMLYMTTEALCDEGDIVLVEDPTYFVYLGIMQSRGLVGRGLRMEADGIDLAHLEETLEQLKRSGEIKRVKMLYLVTYFQNPSGRTTSYAKKVAALKLLRKYEKAAGHPIYLLEDAAYRELRFTGDDVPSALTAPGGLDRVIYAGTFSKPFATGIRVGFGLLPEPLLTIVLRIKGNHDFGTANLLQQLLRQAMLTGAYRRHVVRLRQRYGGKAAVMKLALEKYFPKEATWLTPNGGLYFWASAPKSIPTGPKSKFFQAALQSDVLYVPGQLCYATDPTRKKPDHDMRLSFGGASEKNITLGIERIGQTLRTVLKKK